MLGKIASLKSSLGTKERGEKDCLKNLMFLYFWVHSEN